MKTEPNIPGEIVLGDREFSVRRGFAVNVWLIAAALISALGDVIFSHAVWQWPAGWRLLILFAPFVAVALWVRCLVRWFRGMDELHRGITLTALLLAVSATLFYFLLWFRLEVTGLSELIFGRRLGWGMGTVSFGILLFSIFYGFGHRILSRRFQ